MAEALRFDIFANDEFSNSFDKLKSHLPSVKTIALGAATAISGIGASLFAMAKTTATTYDNLGKFSDQTKISTKFLSEMAVAAQFSGVEVGEANDSMKELTLRLGEAAQGSGSAKEALEKLGISLYDANGQFRTTENILPEIADRIQNMTSASERAYFANQLMGESGVKMIKVLKDGSEGLKNYADEAAAMGLVVDKQAAANAAKFNDALFKVQGTLTGLKNEIGERVIPIVTGLAENFSVFVKNNRARIIQFGETVISVTIEIVEKMSYGVGIIIDSWRGLQMLWQTLKIGLNEFAKFYIMSYQFIIDKSISLMETLNFRGIFDSAISSAKNWSDTMQLGIDTLQESADEARNNLYDLASQTAATEKVEQFVSFAHEKMAEIRALGEAEIEEAQVRNDAIVFADKWKNEQIVETAKKSQEDKKKILKKEVDDNLKAENEKRQNLLNTFSYLQALRTGFGKAGFRIAQAGSISTAWMNTHEAITKALASAPPPFNFALAALVGAAGAAQVANISSQKFSAPHGGMTNVPREQTMLIDQGERILSPNQNRDFTQFMKEGNGGSTITVENINILPNATNAEMLLSLSESQWDDIVETGILPALRKLDRRGLTIQ